MKHSSVCAILRASPLLASLLLGSCSHAATRSEADSKAAQNNRERTPSVFRYNETSGECRNTEGNLGLNPLPALSDIREGSRPKPGVNAECADLSTLSLEDTYGPGYKTLAQWNLRGARFGSVPLRFVKFVDADLRGVHMDKALLLYSEISAARIDAFSKLPSNCPLANAKAEAQADASASAGTYGCRR